MKPTTITDRRGEDDGRREEDFNLERLRAPWQAVAWILAVVVSVLVTYNATANSIRDENKATTQRVAVLEAKQENIEQRQSEIFAALQRLNEKMDRLLERPEGRR